MTKWRFGLLITLLLVFTTASPINCETEISKIVEDLESRVADIELMGGPTDEDKSNRALGDFYLEFKDQITEVVTAAKTIAQELTFLREDVNLNTKERTENTRLIERNSGSIKSNSEGVTLNRTLLLAVVTGVIGWLVKKTKKKDPSKIILT